MVKTKKAGLLTKIVVLALLIYLATSLLNLQGQIASAQAERDDLSRQVAAQTQANADLADDVENSGDLSASRTLPATGWAWLRRTSAFSSPRTERGSPG